MVLKWDNKAAICKLKGAIYLEENNGTTFLINLEIRDSNSANSSFLKEICRHV